MLDYKTIIIKRYALNLSGREIARQIGASKSGVNEFLKAFEECDSISYPLPNGITNYGIAELVYGNPPGNNGRNPNIEYPDYGDVNRQLSTRKNMTLVFLWNRYKKKCEETGRRYYQYRLYFRYDGYLSGFPGLLLCCKSRRHYADQGMGCRVGSSGYPRKRHRPRLYENRTDKKELYGSGM